MFRVRFIQGPMNKVEKYQHLINLLVKQYVWPSPTKEALTFMSKQPDRRKQNKQNDIQNVFTIYYYTLCQTKGDNLLSKY